MAADTETASTTTGAQQDAEGKTTCSNLEIDSKAASESGEKVQHFAGLETPGLDGLETPEIGKANQDDNLSTPRDDSRNRLTPFQDDTLENSPRVTNKEDALPSRPNVIAELCRFYDEQRRTSLNGPKSIAPSESPGRNERPQDQPETLSEQEHEPVPRKEAYESFELSLKKLIIDVIENHIDKKSGESLGNESDDGSDGTSKTKSGATSESGSDGTSRSESDHGSESESGDEIKHDFEVPENIDDSSAARLQWLRQKEEDGVRNQALDQVMCLIGVENVKVLFLSMKAAIDAAKRRREDHMTTIQLLNVQGKGGTASANAGIGNPTWHQITFNVVGKADSRPGKRTIRWLFDKFKISQGIPRAPLLRGPLLQGSPCRPRTVTLNDYSDDELHEFLKRTIKKRGMDVEGAIDGFYTRTLARRIGRGRGSGSFQNMRSVNEAFEAACDRQADRLDQERVLWLKGGQEGDPPNDYFLTKEDLFGSPPTDIRQTSTSYQKVLAMTGLENVKQAVEELTDLPRQNYDLEMKGKEPIPVNLNRVFLGPPGSGKSTVAQLFGQIIVDLGLVSKQGVVFSNPIDFNSTIVGGEQGKTMEMLDKTAGGVLIIDNAHGLCPMEDTRRSISLQDQKTFAVWDTIVAKTSGDLGQDRCIILVGYAEQMRDMFHKCNPGLRSRFPLEHAFKLDNYPVPELMKILDARLQKDGVEATEQAKEVASQVLTRARDRPGFGNGREVHNLVNRARASQRRRASESPSVLPPKDFEGEGGLPVSGDTGSNEHTMLEPQDFDPYWDRPSVSAQHIKDLFKTFVGFDRVIQQFRGYQETVAGMRLHDKDPRPHIPFNFIFKGPPGTGKTSTARKVGKIFYDMGFLSSDDVIECAASDLIGQYHGHTAPLVRSYLDKALGKVLFIDEAYRLAAKYSSSASFEQEAVAELVDALTKPKYVHKMVIILAGYSQDMDRLLMSNRGLRGRFATEVVFPKLTPDQCIQYLEQLVGKMDVKIEDRRETSSDKKDKVYRLFQSLSDTRGWSNGRDVETLARIVIGDVFQKEGRKGNRSAHLQVSTDELIDSLRAMLRSRLAGELLSRG
ncbi:Stage V sporulation K [Fusarium albosuccineum]|uniref:Stage V sporulation K n=1 Tax=Fusarium albosuccineum TaxID=1237068 RepID=A0A8H4P7M6_9HYPO|nr:Stage V sporulation K [Fusarium albosuccineum]